jgi:hypothetical protein
MSELADCEYALEQFVQKVLEIAIDAYNDGDIDGLKMIIKLCEEQLKKMED